MKANRSAHHKILRLQKRIFRSLQEEANLLLGETPRSIREYEKECQRDFSVRKSSFRSIQKSDLIEAVRSTDVTFIADFHTFDQAQRTALRIMRDSIRPKENWYIGLEMISSEFQKDLDDFQNGKLSLKAFQNHISYNHEWGFPWSHYAPIFEWAIQNKTRLIALNRPKAIARVEEKEDLDERDRWAAGIITDLFHSKTHKPKMIVLYGELHVGSSHLPRQLHQVSRSFLKTPLSSISVHQNNDRIFWKLAEQQKELHTEAIQLKKGIYCVFSSTPWAKLQSLVNWAEVENSTENTEETSDQMDEDFDLDEDTPEIDHLATLQTYGNTISEFLGVSAANYESVTVCTIDQMESLRSVLISDAFTPDEQRLIHFHVNYHHRLFIPRLSIAYLGAPSLNAAAELAAIHLLHSVTRSKGVRLKKAEDFFRITLEFAFGFFGSLILNPRRKCDLPQDHQKRIQDLSNRSKPRFPLELEARETAMTLLQRGNHSPFPFEDQLKSKKLSPAFMMAARYLGQILGKRLYQALIEDRVSIESVRNLFFLKDSSEFSNTHEDKLNHLYKMTSKIPLAPTKNQSL
jgi:hypothetical protein